MSSQTSEQFLGWRLGGPQGSGVDKISTLFARACVLQGQQVICRREYHSNIYGRHSYCDIAIGMDQVTCHREHPDFLVTFEAESLCRHISGMADRGCLIYNVDDSDKGLDEPGYLDKRLRQDLIQQLSSKGLETSVNGLLALARQRGIHTLAIPYTELNKQLAAELAIKRQRAARLTNTVAVAISASLLNLSMEALFESVKKCFPGNAEIVQWNQRAIEIAYRYASEIEKQSGYRLLQPSMITAQSSLLLNGTQSVALGKLAGGLGFQSYYPISPATDESIYLDEHHCVPLATGEVVGPLIVQVEDELAAVTMACGAALTGARSATSTSGPGFSLMAEGLGWAGMNEVPLVISLYQRGGPSTGLPTRTDQGDLQFVIHGGHGEFPRMVLASGDVKECFHDAVLAFDYAERFQLPVIHLLDKALASTTQSLPPFDVSKLHINRGELYESPPSRDGDTQRFALTPSGISPRPLLGQQGGQHWLTGVEHTTEGIVSEDPVIREKMMEKRARKLQTVADTLPSDEKFRLFGDPAAALTVLTWGSNKGAVLDALQRLTHQGIATRAVQLRLLWPFPAKELGEILVTADPLVVVECNYSGQLRLLLQEQTGYISEHLIVKYSGRPISGESLAEVLQKIHHGEVTGRIVLRNPYE